MNRLILTFAFIILSTAGMTAQFPSVDDGGLPKPATSTLRARVFYEDTGRPVKRMSVMLMSKARGREFSGTTDANGNLEIKNLQAGKYYAIVNAPGVVTPLAYVDFRRSRGESLEDQFLGFPAIEVNGISDVTTSIPARRGGAISGRVMYSDGDSAIGVKVEILRKVGGEFLPTLPNLSVLSSISSGGAGMFMTDDRGVYRFAGLPAGEYLVKVTENVLHSSNERQSYNEFETLFSGNGSLVSVYFENAFLKENAQTINVEFGQELSEINITIPDRELHSVEGKLIAAKDKLPIRNTRLSIKSENEDAAGGGLFDRRAQSVQSDENGVWKFTQLPKGTYKISVEPGIYEFDPVARAYGQPTAAPANVAYSNSISYGSSRKTEKQPLLKFAKAVKEFTTDDKDLPEQIIELEFGATLIGTVTLEQAKDNPGSVNISANSKTSELDVSTSVWFYDYSGGKPALLKSQEFRLEGVAPGKNFIQIRASDSDYYVKSAESSQIDLLKGSIEVKDGETLANIKIVLSNETGILKGLVIDEDRQPVAGFLLTLVPTDPAKFKTPNFTRSLRTDEKGEFEIKLPPFEYAMLPIPAKTDFEKPGDYYEWLAGALKQSQAFKIEIGKTTRATINGGSKKTSR